MRRANIQSVVRSELAAVANGSHRSTMMSLPPDPAQLLNLSLARQGIEYAGNGARLRWVMQRLRAGRHVSVAAVGGSVSAGRNYEVVRGAAGTALYHSLVATVLRQSAMRLSNRPPDGVSHHNGALPATGPSFFEHCIGAAVPNSSHLVLLEFALNTLSNFRAFERMLLRILMRRPRPPAVIVVNVHAWTLVSRTSGKRQRGVCFNQPTPRQIARGMKGRRNTPLGAHIVTADWLASPAVRADQSWRSTQLFDDEDAIARVCRHYGVPLVSMRAALLGAVRDGSIRLSSFTGDCKHPNEQGHLYLAQLVLERLLASVEDGREGDVTPSLPEGSFEWTQRESCAVSAALPQLVLRSSGFNYTDEGRGKPGLVATQAGASVTLCVASKGSGGSAVFVGYLESYEGMGRAAVSCANRCECGSGQVLDAHAPAQRVSVTAVRPVQVVMRRGDASASRVGKSCCELTLRVLPTSASGGSKFKVMSLITPPRAGLVANNVVVDQHAASSSGRDCPSCVFPG